MSMMTPGIFSMLAYLSIRTIGRKRQLAVKRLQRRTNPIVQEDP